MNTTTSTKFVQQLHCRLMWAYETAQHVIEKQKHRHKRNYNNKIRYTQFGVGERVLLKRRTFKGKHEIQDLWEDAIYHVEGEPYTGLLVFKIAQLQGNGKVKIVH